MAQCEMCNASKPLSPVIIEGVKMSVCNECKKFGKSVDDQPSRPGARRAEFVKRAIVETNEFVVANAGQIVKAEREKRGLKQIDLSRMLNIRESVIHQLESGKYKPTLEEAKKIEKGLDLQLVAKEKITDFNQTRSSSVALTIGDLLKGKIK